MIKATVTIKIGPSNYHTTDLVFDTMEEWNERHLNDATGKITNIHSFGEYIPCHKCKKETEVIEGFNLCTHCLTNL